MHKIIPIIMAGGSGSRLWPRSRQQYPKQCLSLSGDTSLLQASIARLATLNAEPAIIIANEDHRFLIAEQLREANLPHNGIILEPVARSTAPAAALAALHARNLQLQAKATASTETADPLLLLLPADHLIQDPVAFCTSITSACPLADAGNIVTFGVKPTYPEVGYGYIQRGSPLAQTQGFKVASFTEKPALEVAKSYIASQDYYWNSGIFLVKASVYLQQLQAYQADVLKACSQAMQAAQVDLDFIRVDQASFSASPDISIDHAIMEKTQDAVVMPLNTDWSDLGNWGTLAELAAKDDAGNSLQGDVIQLNSRNSYVYAENKLVTLIGIEDQIIVETKDAVLVAKKSQVQAVKQLVQQLQAQQRPEYRQHRETFRPWGKYDLIDQGPDFQVKRLSVKPGGKLSTQMHHHRAEHWIVVSGTAKITHGEQTFLLTANQSTYIPIGTVHALENPGKIPLEMIEVQSGSYLKEDDIVRFKDEYGRD